MEFLVRLAHCHFSFRQPELEALASLFDVDLEFVYYSDEVCQANKSFTRQMPLLF